MLNEFAGHWISTLCVPQFDFLSPRVEDIHIEDIAHALSMKCRFNGHVKKFYSIAEHSVLVARVLTLQKADKETVLAGLLHDAVEAYLPDFPKPVKQRMPETQIIYERVDAAICVRFGLRIAEWSLIRDIDERICTTEAKALGLWNEDWRDTGEPLDVKIHCWKQPVAEYRFIRTFNEIVC